MNIDFDIKCTTGGFSMEYPTNECLQNLLGGGIGITGPTGTNGLIACANPPLQISSTLNCVEMTPAAFCGAIHQYVNGAWGIYRSPGITEVTVGATGPLGSGANYPNVATAVAGAGPFTNCLFIRVTDTISEPGILNLPANTLIYVDPGVTWIVDPAQIVTNGPLILLGNQSLGSSSIDFRNAPIPSDVITGPGPLEIRNLNIIRTVGLDPTIMSGQRLFSPTMPAYIQNCKFVLGTGFHLITAEEGKVDIAQNLNMTDIILEGVGTPEEALYIFRSESKVKITNMYIKGVWGNSMGNGAIRVSGFQNQIYGLSFDCNAAVTCTIGGLVNDISNFNARFSPTVVLRILDQAIISTVSQISTINLLGLAIKLSNVLSESVFIVGSTLNLNAGCLSCTLESCSVNELAVFTGNNHIFTDCDFNTITPTIPGRNLKFENCVIRGVTGGGSTLTFSGVLDSEFSNCRFLGISVSLTGESTRNKFVNFTIGRDLIAGGRGIYEFSNGEITSSSVTVTSSPGNCQFNDITILAGKTTISSPNHVFSNYISSSGGGTFTIDPLAPNQQVDGLYCNQLSCAGNNCIIQNVKCNTTIGLNSSCRNCVLSNCISNLTSAGSNLMTGSDHVINNCIFNDVGGLNNQSNGTQYNNCRVVGTADISTAFPPTSNVSLNNCHFQTRLNIISGTNIMMSNCRITAGANMTGSIGGIIHGNLFSGGITLDGGPISATYPLYVANRGMGAANVSVGAPYNVTSGGHPNGGWNTA